MTNGMVWRQIAHAFITCVCISALTAELRLKLGTAYLNCASKAKEEFEKAQNFREHSSIHQEAAAGDACMHN